MPTFAGKYIQEPADLRSVCTEADIIAVCDDPGGETMRDLQTFAELSVAQKEAVVAVMDDLIEAVENEIESYARRQGYAIPLSPVDPLVGKLAGRMLWIDMLQRKKSLQSDAAEDRRKVIRRQLEDIADGRLVLTAVRAADKVPQSATVFSFTDEATRDTDARTPRLSRKSMESW